MREKVFHDRVHDRESRVHQVVAFVCHLGSEGMIVIQENVDLARFR